MEAQNLSESKKLKSAIRLLKESWQVYRGKAKTLLGIMAVMAGFNIFSNFLIDFLNSTDARYSAVFSVLLAAISLISLFIWGLSIPSLIFAIKDDIGIKESYRRGLRILISYVWIYILSSIFILGGSLVLILPGILFYVSFSLTSFVLVFENKKGLRAIWRSKFLVSGNFWRVLRRFIALGFLVFIIFIVPYLVLLIYGLPFNIIGSILGFFITPFILIYGASIYKNLEEIKREISFSEPPMSGKLKYVLPGFLGLIAFAFIITFSILNIVWGRDELPPNDRDLMLSKVEISNQEENAIYWLVPYTGFSKRSSLDQEYILSRWPEGKEKLNETKIAYWPADKDKSKLAEDIASGKAWDENLAKEILDNNTETLADFDKAANSPYYQDPILGNPENINPFSTFISPNNFRTIAKINLIKSSDLFNQGKEKESFDEAMKVVRFGYLIQNSQGYLMNYLLGAAIKEKGMNKARSMLAKTNISAEDLKKYIGQLDELKDNGQGLEKSMKADYIEFNYYKKIIDMAYEGKVSKKQLEEMGLGYNQVISGKVGLGSDSTLPMVELTRPVSYLYKPNQTQRFYIEDTRSRVNNSAKDYYSEMDFNEKRIYSVISEINSSGPMIIFTENPIGKIVYGATAVSLNSLFAKKSNENFSISSTQTLMALKAYKNDKGSLPATLDELVPLYLSEVPRDYFDGNSVRYSREKNIIYSVGQDLKDNNGLENGKEEKDVVYHIEF